MMEDWAQKEESEKKIFDLSLYISKYVIPVLERKRMVLSIFIVCLIVSMVLSTLLRPQFITNATMLIEQPRTMVPVPSPFIPEELVPKNAPGDYVINQIQKLQRSVYASEVMKLLDDRAKADLKTKLGLYTQIMERLYGFIGRNFGTNDEAFNEEALVHEMQSRLNVSNGFGTSIIRVSVRTVDRAAGSIILKNYIDIWIKANLQENRKEIKAKREFVFDQRNKAYKEFKEAEEKLIGFKRRYQMPAEVDTARDIELQLEMDSLQSDLKLAKTRFDQLDNIYLETQMKEAGIVGNITVMGPPMTTYAPTRLAGKKVITFGAVFGLALGIGLALLLDLIRAPIRHESDIIAAVQLPVIGHIPRV